MSKPIGTYTNKFIGEYDAATDTWHIVRGFWFIRPNGDPIHVPSDWDSDLASTKILRMIPVLWSLFPQSGPWNQACVLHDYICGAELFPILLCNKIFQEALIAEPAVPRWKIWPMKTGVDLGCWATYRQHTTESVKKLRGLAGLSGDERPLWKDGKSRFNQEEICG